MSARAAGLLVLIAIPSLARGEEGGAFSLPLPSADLPDGVLTIKVVGDGMGDLRVGQEVRLERLEGEKVVETRSARAGEDGRARFDGLRAGASYRARASAEGKERLSQPFAGPEKGGLRLLLTLGAGGASPHPGSGEPASPGDAMPPGHPAVPGAGGMPPGHPSTEAGGGAAELTPDRSLPDGTILVQVGRGRERKPLPGARVRVKTSVAGIAQDAVTDSEGQLRLALGGGATSQPGRRPASRPAPASAPASQPAAEASAVVTVLHDGMSYSSARLVAPTRGGLRAHFTVYDRSADASLLSVGPGSHYVTQAGEGALSFMWVLNLVNGGDRVYDPGSRGLALPLPDGARGVELPDDQRGLASADSESRTLRLLTPVPPGRLLLRVFFEIPYEGEELELRQRYPLPAGELFLRLLKDPGVKVGGPALAQGVEPVAQGEERAFPLAPIKAGGTLELSFSALPHRDRRPIQAALALALALALWAIVAGLLGPRRRRERAAQREQLLAQLVQLERGKKKNAEEVARRRRELVAELRQVWDEPW